MFDNLIFGDKKIFFFTSKKTFARPPKRVHQWKTSSISISVITNNFVPGYLGIMVTRNVQFCCIFAATKDKLDYFLKKLFH
jgi:hypothetical protein